MGVCVCVTPNSFKSCVCVCVCHRERESQRERERGGGGGRQGERGGGGGVEGDIRGDVILAHTDMCVAVNFGAHGNRGPPAVASQRSGFAITMTIKELGDTATRQANRQTGKQTSSKQTRAAACGIILGAAVFATQNCARRRPNPHPRPDGGPCLSTGILPSVAPSHRHLHCPSSKRAALHPQKSSAPLKSPVKNQRQNRSNSNGRVRYCKSVATSRGLPDLQNPIGADPYKS